jgi:hypothetical protein
MVSDDHRDLKAVHCTERFFKFGAHNRQDQGPHVKTAFEHSGSVNITSVESISNTRPGHA